MSDRFESEGQADRGGENELRGEFAAGLGANIEQLYAATRSRDFCVVGSAVGTETGDVSCGALRALRIMGRSDHCVFVDVDAGTGDALGCHSFRITESGEIDGAIDTVLLAKAMAISTPAAARQPIELSEFGRLRREALAAT